MPVRENTVVAAQWSPNGSLPKGDLTLRGAEIFGSNVFGTDEQRKRLPKQVYR